MTGADQRVTMAREYLTGARKHKVGAMPPSVLVRECAELRRQLGRVLDAIEDAGGLPGGDGTEPYCTACGQWAGLFHGLDGWRHFRGDPAPGGQRELYDAGHPAVIGWTRPQLLPPGGVATVLAALGEAADELRDRAASCGDCGASPAELCTMCESRLERAERYGALAVQMGGAR